MGGPKVQKTVTKKITTEARYEFNEAELRKRLRLPGGARIFVRVPGGGDWSNTDLEIEDGRPLLATVVTTEDK